MKYLFSALLIICFNIAKSQDTSPANVSDFNQMSKILPPPPNAASLGKYGDLNTMLSSGGANFSIPLENYSTGKINVPISLSYMTNGIKVDEISSRAGMEWNLISGGVITRTAYGNIDDNVISAPPPNTAPSQNLLDWLDRQADPTNVNSYNQPDIFSFSFNGYSGKFILDTAYNVAKMEGTPVLLTYSPLKIQTKVGNYTFKITTPDGVQYFFGSPTATEFSYAYPTGGGCPLPYNNNAGTAFYLSKIVHPDNDTVNFVYAPITYSYKTSTSETIYQYDGNGNNQYCTATTGVAPPPANIPNTTCLNWLQTKGVLLQEINSPNWGKVRFTYINRNDINDKLVSTIKYYKPSDSAAYKTYSLTYQYSFSASAYVNSYTTDSLSRRPFLRTLTESSSDGLSTKKHTFNYNDINALPPRLSFAQDDYGFFNGKNNTTLIPVSSNPVYQQAFPMATANRVVDPNYSLKGLLTSITYPTGGKDSIMYESNQIADIVITPPHQATIQASAYSPTLSGGGVIAYSNVATSAIDQQATLTASCTSGSAGETNFKTTNIYFTDETTGSVILNQTLQYNQSLSQTYLILTNHSYKLKVTATGQDVTGLATLSYKAGVPTYSNQVVNAPGARVIRIISADNVANVNSIKRYYYNTLANISNPNSSSGVTIYNVQYENLLKQRHQCGDSYHGFDCNPIVFNFYTMHSNSIYNLYAHGPAPVSYKNVVESLGENFDNGGVEHQFTVVSDFIAGNYYGDMIINAPVTSFAFRDGLETYQGIFKKSGSSYVYNKKVFTHYEEDPRMDHAVDGYLVNKNYVNYAYNICFVPSIELGNGQYNLSHYLVYQKWVYADTVKTWNYDINGQNYSEEKSITEYGNPAHALPTKLTTYASDGLVKVQYNYYPQDLTLTGAPETARQQLVTNLISPILQQKLTKNNAQLYLLNTEYNVFGNGLALPQRKIIQVLNNSAESRIVYNSYDDKGNIIDESQTNGASTSYQWGYNKAYPVSQVTNAKSNDIFYDSFEEGDGYSTAGDAKTGRYSHTGPYSKSITGLDNGTYTLSYWQKTGTTWSLQSSSVTVSGGHYTINLSGQIDDVRFYPSISQMTTYTYDPLVGMTSSTDPKGQVTYYEYDSFQRLMNIKDQNGNIVKHMDYHYQGQ